MSEHLRPVGHEEPVTPPAPTRAPWLRPPKLFLLIGAAVVVVAAIVVTLVLTLSGGSRNLMVAFDLLDFDGGSTCAGGAGGYGDIGPGTDVVVRDEDNHVLGTAQLGDGKSANLPNGGGCAWITTVKDVPTGKNFYSVEVGHRGSQVYSSSQLDKNGWSVELSLGGP